MIIEKVTQWAIKAHDTEHWTATRPELFSAITMVAIIALTAGVTCAIQCTGWRDIAWVIGLSASGVIPVVWQEILGRIKPEKQTPPKVQTTGWMKSLVNRARKGDRWVYHHPEAAANLALLFFGAVTASILIFTDPSTTVQNITIGAGVIAGTALPMLWVAEVNAEKARQKKQLQRKISSVGSLGSLISAAHDKRHWSIANPDTAGSFVFTILIIITVSIAIFASKTDMTQKAIIAGGVGISEALPAIWKERVLHVQEEKDGDLEANPVPCVTHLAEKRLQNKHWTALNPQTATYAFLSIIAITSVCLIAITHTPAIQDIIAGTGLIIGKVVHSVWNEQVERAEQAKREATTPAPSRISSDSPATMHSRSPAPLTPSPSVELTKLRSVPEGECLHGSPVRPVASKTPPRAKPQPKVLEFNG